METNKWNQIGLDPSNLSRCALVKGSRLPETAIQVGHSTGRDARNVDEVWINGGQGRLLISASGDGEAEALGSSSQLDSKGRWEGALSLWKGVGRRDRAKTRRLWTLLGVVVEQWLAGISHTMQVMPLLVVVVAVGVLVLTVLVVSSQIRTTEWAGHYWCVILRDALLTRTRIQGRRSCYVG